MTKILLRELKQAFTYWDHGLPIPVHYETLGVFLAYSKEKASLRGKEIDEVFLAKAYTKLFEREGDE